MQKNAKKMQNGLVNAKKMLYISLVAYLGAILNANRQKF
jgi:hypothetical protein